MKKLALVFLLVGCGSNNASTPANTLVVAPGASIQAAILQAGDGWTIEVPPGVYKESLDIAMDHVRNHLTLKGRVVNGMRAVLEGEGQRQNGVFVAGATGFTIEGFQVQNYKENGVWVGMSQQVVFRDLVVDKTGKYGIFPQGCTDVLVEKSQVTHVADAAIYVGQSTGDIVVQDNEVSQNVAGIECENSLDCDIRRNHSHDNVGGILVFTLPHLLRKDNRRARVHDNVVENNNTANFANPTDIVANVPTGGGITIIGADECSVYANTIKGNHAYAVAVVNLKLLTGNDSIDVDPDPDRNSIQNNLLDGNGTMPTFMFLGMTFPTGDLAWDGTGGGNCESGNVTGTPRWVLVPMPKCT